MKEVHKDAIARGLGLLVAMVAGSTLVTILVIRFFGADFGLQDVSVAVLSFLTNAIVLVPLIDSRLNGLDRMQRLIVGLITNAALLIGLPILSGFFSSISTRMFEAICFLFGVIGIAWVVFAAQKSQEAKKALSKSIFLWVPLVALLDGCLKGGVLLFLKQLYQL